MLHAWRFAVFGKETEREIECEVGTRTYDLMNRLNNGLKIDDADKEFITRESMQSTCVRNQICRNGFAYDFRPFMKRYIYKQHGQWTEIYAFSRAILRKVVYGKIQEISELKNQFKED